MARRTIENCTVLKRTIAARNEDLVNDCYIEGKCGGVGYGTNMYNSDEDVIYPCQNCSLYYKNEGESK